MRTAVANRVRVLPLLLLIWLVASCAGRTAVNTAVDTPAPTDLAQLWVEPFDLESRDLFYGSGGAALAPDMATPYQLVAADNSGYSPGYDVTDAGGTKWSVKLGIEAQPEVVASRVLWALGYHQPPTYLLAGWTLIGVDPSGQGPGRFRREQSGHTVIDEWSWYANPFVGTQPFKGLVVANLMLNNWDWKTSNNKIYEIEDAGGRRRAYVVRDLGASLGKTSFPPALAWTPFRAMAQGSRNDIDGFEEQGFIKRRNGDRVEFHYRGVNASLLDTISPDDVVWVCRLMARISDQQWSAAFRAAGYQDAEQRRFIAKLKSKIQEGLALAST